MKLTPEQKAFYEYGRAKLALQLKIDSIREYTILAWRRYYDDMSKSERRIICDQHALGRFVEQLREKRAACRAWAVEERYCCICAHGPMNLREKVCWTCIHHHHWEPRKEGE